MTGCRGDCQQGDGDCTRECPLFEAPVQRRDGKTRLILWLCAGAVLLFWAVIGYVKWRHS